jgi:hypothetical protein
LGGWVKKILVERSNRFPTFFFVYKKEKPMKLTTIALAIALAVPGTAAFARGTMNYGAHSVRPYSGVRVGSSGRIATMPRNISGNTLGPIAHDPSGSTLTGSAMRRAG